MELILKVNECGYSKFLSNEVDAFIIGLKGFTSSQTYALDIKELKEACTSIHNKNKKIYLNIDMFALEDNLIAFKKIFDKVIDLDIDKYVVSDLGIFNLFKKVNLENKVILDLQTYVTNKYSARSLLDLGASRVILSKEITLEEIKEISEYNKGKIEILAQGYYPITYSKRPIVDLYYNRFKLKKNKEINYIKEENRDSYYLVNKNNNTLAVYNDSEYSLFPYLKELYNVIDFYVIDGQFIEESIIKDYIEYYHLAFEALKNNNFDEYDKLLKLFNDKYTFKMPFISNKSFLLKEGN